MQIRIGNKQDEPACRELAAKCTEEAGATFDLNKRDSDLRNIELSYIGQDGIFLVAEKDERVIAFAAARRGENDSVCAIRRIYVSHEERQCGLGKKLVDHLRFFARNLEYKTLQIDRELFRDHSDVAGTFLSAIGFTSPAANRESLPELAVAKPDDGRVD